MHDTPEGRVKKHYCNKIILIIKKFFVEKKTIGMIPISTEIEPGARSILSNAKKQ